MPANTLYAVLLLGVLGLLGAFGYLVISMRAGLEEPRAIVMLITRRLRSTRAGCPRGLTAADGPTRLGVRDAGAVDDVGELSGGEWLNVAGDRQGRDVLEVQHVAGAGGGQLVVREPDVAGGWGGRLER